MAETNAISSFGTKIQQGDGGDPTEAFTDIGEIRDINGPGMKLDTIEVTHHLSPNATREWRPTLKDLGEVSFEIAFDPANGTHDATTGLWKDHADRTKRNFRLVFPDAAATTFEFAAYVTGIDFKAPVEGIITADITLRPTGVITDVTT